MKYVVKVRTYFEFHHSSSILMFVLLGGELAGKLENKRRAYYQRTWWSHADIYHFLDMNKIEIYIYILRAIPHKYTEVSKFTKKGWKWGETWPGKALKVDSANSQPFEGGANPILTQRECRFLFSIHGIPEKSFEQHPTVLLHVWRSDNN